MSRSYGHYCGLARALDVIGDRWNLLIVRQLLMGPARYRELLDGLPGVATNLLADRLRDLEAAGVIERRPAATGNAVVYALTPWGAELRKPIDGLIRWSTPLMATGPNGDPFRPEWLAVALPALLGGGRPVDVDGGRRAGLNGGQPAEAEGGQPSSTDGGQPTDTDDEQPTAPSPTVGLAIDGQLFQVQVTTAGVEVAPHDGRPLDAVLRAEAMIILGLAAGAIALDDIREHVKLEGDEEVLRAVFAR